MKKMKKNEWIAVSVSLAALAFLFYGGTLLNLFNPQGISQTDMDTLPETGVLSEDVVQGQGDIAAAGDTVTVNYVGTLTNGQVFDSSISRNEPFTFTLGVGQVIRGWDEGLVGMRVGGKRRLIIAPDFAYGQNAVGPIPANSTLVFEVELLSVERPAGR